jgi:acyl transferase domain-containing protein
MIGHLNVAAGIAGLVRVACALEAGVVPPTLGFTRANPELALERGPFVVAASPIAWPSPRVAAISSFGLGGSNAHVIVSAG